MTIEVSEPGSDEEQYLFCVFRAAKEFLVDKVNHPNGVVPTAFVFGGDGGLSIIDLRYGLDDEEAKTAAAAVIKKVALDSKADCWALLSDVYVTQFKMTTAEIEAAGLNPRHHRSWSQAERDLVGYRRSEALMVMMESRKGAKVLRQRYHRHSGEVVFDDVDVTEDSDPTGRFCNLLPPKN